MLFNIRLLLGATAGFALCGLPAIQAQQLSAQDRTFMEDAAKGGMHEIQMGHLGIERGQSQAVKGFSQRLINDHNLANRELAALAKQRGVMLPADEAKRRRLRQGIRQSHDRGTSASYLGVRERGQLGE